MIFIRYVNLDLLKGRIILKKILVIVKDFDRAIYFFRLKMSLEKNYKCIFLTYQMSVYYYLKYHRCDVHLMKNNVIKYKSSIDLRTTIEFKLNRLDIKNMEKIYSITYYYLNKINKKESINYIFIWNGTSIFDLAGIEFAKINNIKTLFFEVANIPKKMFIDRQGTNANSELQKNISVLNKYKINDRQYSDWKNKYINNKLKKHIVPQAKERKYIKICSLVNIMGYIFYTHIGYNFDCIKRKIQSLRKNTINFIYDNINYTKRKYIFFPLQVSNDSQILIHSDIGLMDAIAYTVNEAQKKHLDLIIKPHPAERNKDVLNRIYQLKQKYNFYFINDNTFKLIKYAEKVVTINSTVGLEAKICGKDVEVLGKAFYKDFTEDDLKKYILGYLINIDYFSDEEISKEAIDELEKRMNS